MLIYKSSRDGALTAPKRQEILSLIQDWSVKSQHSPSERNLKKFIDQLVQDASLLHYLSINDSKDKDGNWTGGSIKAEFIDHSFRLNMDKTGLKYRSVLFAVSNRDHSNYNGLASKAVYSEDIYKKDQSIDKYQGLTD